MSTTVKTTYCRDNSTLQQIKAYIDNAFNVTIKLKGVNGITVSPAQAQNLKSNREWIIGFDGSQIIDAGAGLYYSGSTLNVGTTSASRIIVAANSIDLATTGVTSGTYGANKILPQLTIDAYGRVTNASNINLSLTKSDVGLGNVDNTSDLNKPISTATQAALDGKHPLENQRLSTTNFPEFLGLTLGVGGLNVTTTSSFFYMKNDNSRFLQYDDGLNRYTLGGNGSTTAYLGTGINTKRLLTETDGDTYALKSTTITAAGNGITGGGSLANNRIFSLDFTYLDGRYAPIFDSNDFIQNQYIIQQSGNFKISGQGCIISKLYIGNDIDNSIPSILQVEGNLYTKGLSIGGQNVDASLLTYFQDYASLFSYRSDSNFLDGYISASESRLLASYTSTPPASVTAAAGVFIAAIRADNNQDWPASGAPLTSHPSLMGIRSSIGSYPGATGTITKAAAIYGTVAIQSGVTINECSLIDITYQHSGTINHANGIRIADIDAGINGVGLFIVNGDGISSPSGYWGIYDMTNYNSYLAGSLQIGSNVSTGSEKLQVTGNSIVTGTGRYGAGSTFFISASPTLETRQLTSTISTSGGYYSLLLQDNFSNTNAASSAAITGVFSRPVILSTNTQNFTNAFVGIQSSPIIMNMVSGTINNVVGIRSGLAILAQTGSGIVTNAIAFQSSALTGAQNHTHLLLGSTTAPTGNWGVYDISGFNSYIGGRLLIGTTTDDGSTRLQVNGAIKTEAPTGSTAKPIKFGNLTTISGTIDTSNGLVIEHDGNIYKLALIN